MENFASVFPSEESLYKKKSLMKKFSVQHIQLKFVGLRCSLQSFL